MQYVLIKDSRDTAAFDEMVVSSSTPIIVTKNGYDRFICIKSSDFNRLDQVDARARLLERIIISEHKRVEGLGTDAFEVTNNLRAKYDL